jgi:hypothetical protein
MTAAIERTFLERRRPRFYRAAVRPEAYSCTLENPFEHLIRLRKSPKQPNNAIVHEAQMLVPSSAVREEEEVLVTHVAEGKGRVIEKFSPTFGMNGHAESFGSDRGKEGG